MGQQCSCHADVLRQWHVLLPCVLQDELADAEWEDVQAGDGGGAAAGAAADTPVLSLAGSAATGGAGSQGGSASGGLAAVLDEDEDWEDV